MFIVDAATACLAAAKENRYEDDDGAGRNGGGIAVGRNG
jgi:hypothetical protein